MKNLILSVVLMSALSLPAFAGEAHTHDEEKTLKEAVSSAATTAQDAFSRGLIEGKVESVIFFNKHLNGYDIDAKIYEGRVILSGNVSKNIEKDYAEQLAYGIEGVTEVTNKIQVNESTKKTNLKSATSKIAQGLKDATITANIKARLLANQNVSGLSINVDTMNREVTLRGTAHDALEKDLVGAIATNTQGVTRVKNEIKILN